MPEKRWGLTLPLEAISLARHADVLKDAERLGYRDAWTLEVDGVDCFTPLAVAASATGLRVGTAIANVFTRGPATLAMSAAGIAELAPGRFCLGIGAGSQPVVEIWNSGKFDRPLARVRDMVAILRDVLAGERVTFDGDTLHVAGLRLSRPPSRPVPIHIAALRPGLLRLAGEVGDGAIINWLSADDVPKVVAEVRSGAKAAGKDPDAIEISCRIMVSVDEPGPAADTMIRRYITTYQNVDVYRRFQHWLGRGETLGPMFDAWDAGDRRGAVAAIPESVIAELIVTGSPQERRDHVQRYLDAGVDTAILYLMSAEKEPGRQAAAVLQGVKDMAPR